MTTEELAAIRKDVEYAASDYAEYYDADSEVCATVQEHAPRLLAEVERLRALVSAHHASSYLRLSAGTRCPICEAAQ